MLGIAAWLLVEEYDANTVEKKNFIKNFSVALGYCYAILSLSLIATVVWLISRIRTKRDQVAHSDEAKAVYNKEIRTLWFILGGFSLSYAIRSFWDIKSSYVSHPTFGGMMADLLLIGLFCDFVPIISLVFFHYRNFRIKKDKSQESN